MKKVYYLAFAVMLLSVMCFRVMPARAEVTFNGEWRVRGYVFDIEGKKVLVTLRGACTACPSSDFTLKGLVQAKLREFVSDDIEVVVES